MIAALPPHRFETAVRFREVDAYRVAWHGHFFDWLESARHRFAAHFGFDTMAALDRGYRLPMLECRIEYRQPARFGDRVAVEVALDEDPRKVVAFRYEVRRCSDGALLATARTAQVVQGADGSLLLGWPSEVAELLEKMRRYDSSEPAASGRSTQKRVP